LRCITRHGKDIVVDRIFEMDTTWLPIPISASQKGQDITFKQRAIVEKKIAETLGKVTGPGEDHSKMVSEGAELKMPEQTAVRSTRIYAILH